jgi:hypothetical protein
LSAPPILRRHESIYKSPMLGALHDKKGLWSEIEVRHAKAGAGRLNCAQSVLEASGQGAYGCAQPLAL